MIVGDINAVELPKSVTCITEVSELKLLVSLGLFVIVEDPSAVKLPESIAFVKLENESADLEKFLLCMIV